MWLKKIQVGMLETRMNWPSNKICWCVNVLRLWKTGMLLTPITGDKLTGCCGVKVGKTNRLKELFQSYKWKFIHCCQFSRKFIQCVVFPLSVPKLMYSPFLQNDGRINRKPLCTARWWNYLQELKHKNINKHKRWDLENFRGYRRSMVSNIWPLLWQH